MSVFYTYLHCRPDGSPFYVGKGTGRRARQFTKHRNNHYKNIVLKYGRANIQIFVFPCDSEEQAFSDEMHHIAQLRSAGYDLCNMTDGGEGCSGSKRSDETRAKMSVAMLGKSYGPLSDEHKRKLSEVHKGKPRCWKSTPEINAKISATVKATYADPAFKAALSASRKGVPKKTPRSPEHCAKISALKKGKSRSAETIAKMALGSKLAWERRKLEMRTK